MKTRLVLSRWKILGTAMNHSFVVSPLRHDTYSVVWTRTPLGGTFVQQGAKVIKVGGSLIFEKEEFALKRIEQLAKTLRNLYEQGHELLVVVGGGRMARKYIGAVRTSGGSEVSADIVGIEISRNNARVMIAALGEVAYPEVPASFTAALIAAVTGKIVVLGGLSPGQSTNAVAALMAEAVSSQLLLNATDVDGVYPTDPREDPHAKVIPRLNIDEFSEIIGRSVSRAGYYPLFDQVALQIVQRGQIEVIFLNGKDPENISKAINGEKIGSKVVLD
ncbi:MAG: UMP kinase [Candidatus Heimdallarchaeota archaeon]